MMRKITDQNGKIYFFNPDLISMVSEASCVGYWDNDDYLPGTQVWSAGTFVSIEMSLDSFMEQLTFGSE